MNKMESPMIVKSLGVKNPFDIKDRIAQTRDQVLTNREAYDIVYPDHRSYYDDKRFIVLDRHFEDTEKYLLNELKSAIDEKLDYQKMAKLVHVDDLDKSQIKVRDMNIQSNAPFVPKEAVATDMRMPDKNDAPKVTSSDPYVDIMSGPH
jgi:hypothetical protein